MLENFNSFYIIGIGGISLSAIAKLLLDLGKKVYGSDITDSKLISELQNSGVEIQIGGAPEYVMKCDAVIITGAISEDNRDLVFAKKLGKQIFTRAQMLGILTENKSLISVAGTHGKTTTTGMIASILLEADKDPTIHIGGISNNIHSNLRIGKSDLFVTEACEYKDSFLTLKNYIAVVLNVEEDHLDYFKNLDNIFASFNKFVQNTTKNGVVVYNFDDLQNKLWIKNEALSFGFNEGADITCENINEYERGKFQFDLIYKGEFLVNIKLPCFGKHNVKNALASSAVAVFLGIDAIEIKRGLEAFKGIERRFEIIKEENGHCILHDYAHHPHEIKASLDACREIVTGGRLICIFQPHTFTRTRDLFDEFVRCFSVCDEVWLLPIYPAREEPIEGITSQALADKILQEGQKCRYFNTFSECRDEVVKEFASVDMFAILGAGDIEKLAYSLKDKN